jgi:hypothetical protein
MVTIGEIIKAIQEGTEDEIIEFGQLWELCKNTEQRRNEAIEKENRELEAKQFEVYFAQTVKRLMKHNKTDPEEKQKKDLASDVWNLKQVAETEPQRKFAHFLYEMARVKNEEFIALKSFMSKKKSEKSPNI